MKAAQKVIKIDMRDEEIFSFMDKEVKKKRIAPMNLKQIEKFVHKARAEK